MSKPDTDHAMTFALLGRVFLTGSKEDQRLMAILEVQHGNMMIVVRVERAGNSWRPTLDHENNPQFESVSVDLLADRIPVTVSDAALSIGEVDAKLPGESIAKLRARLRGR